MKYTSPTLIFLLMLSGYAHSTGTEDKVWQTWVPKGWKLIANKTGDLNKDGLSDAVLVLEENNPSNRKTNESLGAEKLNLNPRRLLVLFQTPTGYQKVFSNDSFLPSENSEDTPCLADPMEEGGVQINNGVLKIELNYWLSCGSYGTSRHSYSFRYENARFRLIGFDQSEFMRNSGESSQYSANLLTGKEKITTGLNEFEKSKPHVKWNKIENSKIYYLEDITKSGEKDNVRWCR